jgi:hypothetical protein
VPRTVDVLGRYDETWYGRLMSMDLDLALVRKRRRVVSLEESQRWNRDLATAIDTFYMAADAIEDVSSNQQRHICADDW